MENKPRKKSMFRSRKSSAIPSIQPADTWSLSESSSFDTLEPSDSIALPLESSNSLVLPIVVPTTTESKNKDVTETEVDVPAGFEHLVETAAPDGNGFLFMQRECEALAKRHEVEITKMKNDISQLKYSNEKLELEHEVLENVTLEQEVVIGKQKDAIKSLKAALAASESLREEKKKEYGKLRKRCCNKELILILYKQ